MVSPPDIVTTVTPPAMIKKQSQGGMPEESMVQSLYEEDVFIPVFEQPQKMDVAIYAEVTQPNGYVSEWMLDPRVVIQRLMGLEKPTDLWQIGGNGHIDLLEDDEKIVIKKPAAATELNIKPKSNKKV